MTDLDRTLTDADLALDPAALERIRLLRAVDVRVVVATGRRMRELEDMKLVDEVDGLVAENGAIIHVPRQTTQVLHADFARVAVTALGDLATRFHWGQVIGSGPRALASQAAARLAAAKVAHGAEFNADEVMLLPPGVDKASGAQACLRELGLSSEHAWAIGDGDNDASLLRWAAVSAAPGNASERAVGAADVLMAASYSQAFLEFTEPLVRSARAGPRRSPSPAPPPRPSR